jgi:hypothetical protein
MSDRPMKPISIAAAKNIADRYGYDQVIIVARRVGEDPAPHGEHCTTYGVTPEHCDVAARCGNRLKREVMGWEGVATLSDGQVDRIIRDVAELPDRTSPEDQPEMMLVTAAELAAILKSK